MRRCIKTLRQGALLLILAALVMAQKYGPDSPIPPGATGKVLPIQGKVVQINGLASAVSGKSESLNAALKDLGAKTTWNEIRIALASDVLFDFDKADLLPKAIPDLEKVATVLKSYPNGTCTIEGYTDSKGNDQYNQDLSKRRAESVKNWLTSHGVTQSTVHARLRQAAPRSPQHPAQRQRQP